MLGLRKRRLAHKLYRTPMGARKRIVGWVIVAGAAAAAVASVVPMQPTSPDPTPASKPEARADPGSADGRFAALPSREAIGKPRGEFFGSRSWAPAAPPRESVPSVAAPAAPVAPPMPYRVAGQVVHDGKAQVVLARDDRVFTVREGDTLDGGYRVASIKADGGVMLVYTPLGVEQHLPVASALALDAPRGSPSVAQTLPPQQAAAGGGPRPAQLRWEGPERVQAGNPFDVALKLTSAQPVRSSPLQLSYDANLLEAVAVRAGGFFADGNFTYRVNPGGSIFVGASGAGAVATDAEFLIVTFRPIRPGAIAELKLSSLVLQGAAGRIVHEPPAAFRTAIVQ